MCVNIRHIKVLCGVLENAQTPYGATVVINGVEYGTGYASSKKAAKNEAAKATLGILIPELKKVTDESHQPDIHDLSVSHHTLICNT